ncbi:hypothetical protein P609_03320 [Comamonas thiooxydans]|nr:hypothetical protein P609_03320 [Comamonas thiooxydans]
MRNKAAGGSANQPKEAQEFTNVTIQTVQMTFKLLAFDSR